MKLVILSNEEHKAEAIRAIVTAQCEMEAMQYCDMSVPGMYQAADRRNDACQWLSLVA